MSDDSSYLRHEFGQLRDHLETRLGSMQSTMERMASSIEKMFDHVGKISGLEAKTTHLENTVQMLEQRVSKVEQSHINSSLNLKGVSTKLALMGTAIIVLLPTILTFILNWLTQTPNP